MLRQIQGTDLVVLVLIFILGFSLRMVFTAQSKYLVNGIDGPYYITQINYLQKTGQMLYKDSPLTFYYLWLWRLLLGDTVQAIKVGMSVVTGLMCIPAFFLMKSITKSSLAGYLAALISVLNPYIFSMTYNVYKNELGIFFLYVYFVIFLRFVDERQHRKWLVRGLGVMLVLIWTTHIMAAGMSVLFTVAYLASIIIVDRDLARRIAKPLALAGVAAAAVLVVAALLFPASFYKIYKLKFLVEILQGQSAPPKFTAPGPRTTRPGFFLLNLDPVRWFGFPALVAIGSVVYALYRRRKVTLALFIVATYLSWLAFVGPWIPRELLRRFTLASFFPLSLAIPYGLWLIYRKTPALLAIPVVALVLGLSATEAIGAAARARPTIDEARYMDLVAMRPHVPQRCVIAGGARESYWFEVVLEKKLVRGHYIEEDFEGDPILLIVDKQQTNPWWFHGPSPPGRRPPPLPEKVKRRATVVFDGRFYTAYLIPPHSVRR